MAHGYCVNTKTKGEPEWEELTKKEKRSVFILIGIVALVLIGIIFGGDSDEVVEEEKAESKPVLSAAEQKEQERKEKTRSQFSLWDSRHIKLTETIKESLHSPDSCNYPQKLDS